MTQQLATLDKDNLPKHIAVIMDGNGRWAKRRGNARVFGHRNAIKAVRDTTEGCAELGVQYLTLYAFSTENWARPKREVDALMELLVATIKSEIGTLQKNNVKLLAIGDTDNLPERCGKQLKQAIADTSHNTGLCLVLALNYSGRWEIMEAMKKFHEAAAAQAIDPNNLSVDDLQQFLNNSEIPDPELLIRTSGEMRISNFLLWQLAYTELYFTEVLWPDFRKTDLYDAIAVYQKRERRFGKTSEQLSN